MSWLLTVVAAVAAQQIVDAEITSQPRIVVQGYGEVRTAPNVATISYKAVGEGRVVDDAVLSLVAKAAAIQNALRSLDPALNLQWDPLESTCRHASLSIL